MNYEQLIETVSEIVSNDNINKRNLTLVYTLGEKNHREMDEHLFYISNPANAEYTHKEVIEIQISGILVKFIKENQAIDYDENNA